MIHLSNILLMSFMILGIYQSSWQDPLNVFALNKVTIKEDVFQERSQRMNKNRNAEVRATVNSIIETMFRKRKIKDGFEQYFRFSKLSAEEKESVDSVSFQYSNKYEGINSKEVIRLFANGWNYEYQPVLLAISQKTLSQFKIAFSEASSEIETERKRILVKRGLTEKDFYNILDGYAIKESAELEKDLAVIELINADLDIFIAKKTNKSILDKNIKEMKKTAIIEKSDKSGVEIYEVAVKPFFDLTFARNIDGFKMIGFSDSL